MSKKPQRMLRQREVQELLGISGVTIWRMIGKGTFPQARKITGKATGWFESEIADWQNALPKNNANPMGHL